VNLKNDDFEGAWERYKMAFNPLYDAIIQGDLKGAHNWVEHVKDVSVDLAKTDMPARYDKGAKKLRKEIMKLTKSLVKSAKERDREGLKQAVSHIKDRIDRLEEARMNNGKSNYDG